MPLGKPTGVLQEETLAELKGCYLADNMPWVVGFSGGKDSSVVVQLIYQMLLEMQPADRQKRVHVVTCDTLVESPVVQDCVSRVTATLAQGARQDGLPMDVITVAPRIDESFWVLLLGRGYPAPNRFFRWCTSRLKIAPTSRYIEAQVNEYGQVIVVLGARKQESSTRAQVLESHRIPGSTFRRHATLTHALVYTPIAEWSTADVWARLTAYEAPWAPKLGLNRELRLLYRDAAGGECPLVIDKSTPACGSSRFGCWTCTVVKDDLAMEGFIGAGGDRQRLVPLLEFRNKLKTYRDDPSKREPWRRAQAGRFLEATHGEPLVDGPASDETPTPGPFKLGIRKELLRDLLLLQRQTGYSLIRDEEIELITSHWTQDYGADGVQVVGLLEEVFGPSARGRHLREVRQLLEQVCLAHDVHLPTVYRLVDLERGVLTKLRKRGLLEAIDQVLDEYLAAEHGARRQ